MDAIPPPRPPLDTPSVAECPRCSSCGLCGGSHEVSRDVLLSLTVRKTSDPDADVRRGYSTLMASLAAARKEPARTWEEWANHWSELPFEEQMAWRRAFTAYDRK